MDRKIPFSPPDITEEEIREVADTLRSGWITTGPKTKQFEKEIAAFCGSAGAVCLNSATAGLELTLRLFGIGPGDEVIVPAYTYTATASVVAHVGAPIVMVDCESDAYTMDPVQLEQAVTDRTKAIIPVDLGGIVCDYDAVFALAERCRGRFHPSNPMQEALGRILVLADASHSFGAERGGKRSGSIADFSCFSFHAVKNLTTAEGGAVTWRSGLGLDEGEIYRQFQLMSLHGQSKDALAKTRLGAWEYDIVAPYYKCNMTDIMASIGLVQLRRYPDLLQRRKELIGLYNKGIADLPVTAADHGAGSSGHLYLARVFQKDGSPVDEAERNRMITALAERGVASNVHYKPLPMHSAYRSLGFCMEDYPNAYRQYQNEITLPLHTLLRDEDVEYVLDCFRQCLADGS